MKITTNQKAKENGNLFLAQSDLFIFLEMEDGNYNVYSRFGQYDIQDKNSIVRAEKSLYAILEKDSFSLCIKKQELTCAELNSLNDGIRNILKVITNFPLQYIY